MDERERRLAENEAFFRDLNEHIQRSAERLGGAEHGYEYICECGNRDCTLRVLMTMGDYEELRSHPTWFAIAPGHELPEVERVVERRARYWIVAKEDGAAELVRARDPRS